MGPIIIPFRIQKERNHMTQKITIEFDTSAYEFAHGKAPKGYGSWAFDWEGTRRDPKPVWAPTSTYADAKKWVRAHIKSIAPADYAGCVCITVCS